jgi:hypothetical protein
MLEEVVQVMEYVLSERVIEPRVAIRQKLVFLFRRGGVGDGGRGNAETIYLRTAFRRRPGAQP